MAPDAPARAVHDGELAATEQVRLVDVVLRVQRRGAGKGGLHAGVFPLSVPQMG